jgi:hypothetical protein
LLCSIADLFDLWDVAARSSPGQRDYVEFLALVLGVPEQCQENDDRDWDSQQPQQNASAEAHFFSSIFCRREQ